MQLCCDGDVPLPLVTDRVLPMATTHGAGVGRAVSYVVRLWHVLSSMSHRSRVSA